MTDVRTSLRALLAGAALLLTQNQPGFAAGFDGAIKNNALALNAAGTVAAVSNSEESAVIVYDVAKGTVLRRLDGFVTPRNIVFAPDGARFYVSDSGTGRSRSTRPAPAKKPAFLPRAPVRSARCSRPTGQSSTSTTRPRAR